MKAKPTFLLILLLGVLGLVVFMQAVIEEHYDGFNTRTFADVSNKSTAAPQCENNARSLRADNSDPHKAMSFVTYNTELWEARRRPQHLSRCHCKYCPEYVVALTLRTLTGQVRKKVQESCKSFLQSFCKKYNQNHHARVNLLFISEMVSQIYVEEKRKVLYCEVPKAGCSNWKRTLMVLSGLAESTDEISHDVVHYRNSLRKLDSFELKEISKRLSSFTKIIVVRQPVEKLVSAFRYKFKQPNAYYHPVFGRAIIRRHRPNATLETLWTGSGVTFREFALYLLDPQRPVGMDVHWETVNNLCFPCIISHDFIGKFETLEQHTIYFLWLIDVPKDLKFPAFKDGHSNDEKTSASVVNRYILQLSPSETQRMYDFFHLDYLTFNYTNPYMSYNTHAPKERSSADTQKRSVRKNYDLATKRKPVSISRFLFCFIFAFLFLDN